MDNSDRKRRDFILKLAKTLGVAGSVLLSPQLLAKRSKRSPAHLLSIKAIKIKKGSNKQRLIFEFDGSVKRSLFSLHKPERIVLDLRNTSLKTSLKKPADKNTLVQGIRYAVRNEHDLRIVFDLAQKVKASTKLHKSDTGYRLELTLAGKSTPKKAKKITKKHAVEKPKAVKQSSKKSTLARKQTKRRDSKHFIVAIDPGHGGKDPGAVGRKGTLEKDVVLKIARRLQQRINKQGDMKAVLTRDGDYYVSLRKRMDKARAEGADLFISIHADANPDRNLTGSSVYILSENGASSEAARWLAENENSYEARLGGALVERNNKVLSSLLLDLSQSATIDNSLGLAQKVLRELSSVNRLLRKQVESASFVVLKSPDIPSMLVETAFISNPDEEHRLNTSHYQRKLANAMFHGIRRYHLTQKKRNARFA